MNGDTTVVKREIYNDQENGDFPVIKQEETEGVQNSELIVVKPEIPEELLSGDCTEDLEQSNTDRLHDCEESGKKLTCVACSKRFPTESSFCAHMLKHLDNVDFVKAEAPVLLCKTCGKIFQSKRELQRHITLEHVDPYVCEMCAKIFKTVTTLETHVKTVHQGERPYPCPTCSCTFVHKNSLTKHIQTVHEHKKKLHLCVQCGKYFTSLPRHVRSVHDRDRSHVCSGCGRGFSSRSNLMTHEKTVHGGERVGCHHCVKQFTSKQCLRMHIQKHHAAADSPTQ